MEWRERQITSDRSIGDTVEVILSVSHLNEDHAALKRILDPTRWRIQEAVCCGAAFRTLDYRPVPAIITNATLPDGDWTHVLRYAQAQPQPPNVIVASHFADDRFWAEVMNLGGYDVLIKPFEAEEVRRVVSLACPLHARGGSPIHSSVCVNFARSAAA